MTISANLHRVSAMTAEQHGGATWLKITGESAVETFTVFMPLRQAEMIADAFDDYNDWLSGQETAPISDYTDAIADLPRQQEAARALK